MTPDDFRDLALALPGAVERSHMSHPDFRVGGKIFASLGPKEAWGMVKLRPEEQARLLLEDPAAFEPIPGAWGRRGCTRVRLESATREGVREAIFLAWRSTAPKRLLRELEG